MADVPVSQQSSSPSGAEVLRSLSFGQILSLSLGLMMLGGLIVGVLFLGPMMFVDIVKEQHQATPESPFAPLVEAMLPLLAFVPYLFPFCVVGGVALMVWPCRPSGKRTVGQREERS